MASKRPHGGRRRRPDPKKALRGQLDRALGDLRGRPPPRDASVHEARKALKSARSTLRLLRCSIGDAAYRRANRRLRDAARPLSRVRDSRVLLDVVARMRDEAKPSGRARLDSLSQQLRSERQRLRREVLDGPQPLRRIRNSVESVQRESRPWPTPANDSLQRAVERIYKKGRRAFAQAETDQRDEELHESRKQAKYLSRALKVLGPARGSAMAKREKLAESIADKLGDDHDLAVLRQKLDTRSPSPAPRSLLSQIEHRRQKLQRKALKRGRLLFARKAKAFAEKIDLDRNAGF